MSIFRSRTYLDFISRSFLLLGALAFLGCTHAARIDLSERRSAGLLADRALLGERERMTFDAPLALDDAVAVGLANNLDLRVSRFMEEIADRNAMSEKLKMLPRLDFEGVYSKRSDFIQREFVNPDTGEVSLSNTVSQDKTTRTLDLSLSWNILDFGLSYLRSRQAAYTVEIRRMERIRQAQTLAADIATAFWRSVLAEEDLKLVGRIEDRLREFKDDADELVAQRRLDPIVAKEMERQLVNLTISAADLQAEVAGARIELARLMGLTPGTRFELDIPENLLEDRLEGLPDPAEIDPRGLEELALRRRPELFSADLREAVQEDEVRSAMIQMFPGLEFSASYRYDGDKFLANPDWFNFGGRFAASLLALPARHAAWNARKIEAEMTRIQRALLSAGIVAQVHVALQNFHIRKRQYRLKEQAYRVSGDLSDMSLERNRAGMAGFSDSVVARRLMETFLSRLERDRTIVAMLGAYHTLMIAVGFDYDQWNRPLAEMDETRIPDPGEPETTEESRMEDARSRLRFPETIGIERSGGGKPAARTESAAFSAFANITEFDKEII
jgi:outer membrane protein TolC